ncbi:LPD7 domain-containing protein (plasmid) [Komagataeibacter intermedius]|uniref:LPD7 domain-containing protein n=1 Tax=Komagataeibacter intermedius TaxID=66229 RepID=UPI0040354311
MSITNNKNMRWMRYQGGIDVLCDKDIADAKKCYEYFLKNQEDNKKVSFNEFIEMMQRNEEGNTPPVIEEDTKKVKKSSGDEEDFGNSVEPLYTDEEDDEKSKFWVNMTQKGYHAGYGPLHFDIQNKHVTMNLPNGVPLEDHGNILKYKSHEHMDAESAQKMANLIQQKGWTTVQVKGSKDFKQMVAKACLAMDPPVLTNVKLPESMMEDAIRSKMDAFIKNIKPNESQNPSGPDRALENLANTKAWALQMIEALSNKIPSIEEIATPKITERKKKTEAVRGDLTALIIYIKEFKLKNNVGRFSFRNPAWKQMKLMEKELRRQQSKFRVVATNEKDDIRKIACLSQITREQRLEIGHRMAPEIQQLKNFLEHVDDFEMAIKGGNDAMIGMFQIPGNMTTIPYGLEYVEDAKANAEKQATPAPAPVEPPKPAPLDERIEKHEPVKPENKSEINHDNKEKEKPASNPDASIPQIDKAPPKTVAPSLLQVHTATSEPSHEDDDHDDYSLPTP